ncbi:MAG: hypothetical protein RMJ55_13460 [Roseiflexaceae bacterium]|nr:hypothetical protein [Roseiflexus sp.]MDW8214561.1 hypothetical protein [Roseiflexaceae bacterium]
MATNPPERTTPKSDWEHLTVWETTKSLLLSIPNYFQTDLLIRGVNATEIFSIGPVFSSILESQIVETLNKLRNVWDKDDKYQSFAFVRRAQAFPDVLLVDATGKEILFGVELKSWYVLSKEGEPSFRYLITPNACADADLLIIVPWILSDVISGSPRLLRPWIESAKYVAEYRNFYWKESRSKQNKNQNIRSPINIKQYPDIRQEACDEAPDDKGGNFGRVARTGIIDSYIKSIKEDKYLGIKIDHWIEFFKSVSETRTDERIEKKISSLRKSIQKNNDRPVKGKAFLDILQLIEDLWKDGPNA